jgi:CDP-glucose 4,6-dehydratase
MKLFNDIYKEKKVLLTGDTGFKGTWMAYLLNTIGANLIGYSLSPNTKPSHYKLLNQNYKSFIDDISNLDLLKKIIKNEKPEIIFHLAAQPLVRQSYLNPIETYNTNVIGTLNILEAAKSSNSVKSIVIITTDKCYENTGQNSGYVENDRMGGYDPYSSSKACVEILTNSYRNSFYNLKEYKISHNTLIATARAGNVIGGGDWSDDRLIPDIVKAASLRNQSKIRNANAVRPWQHVLEPIFGYLLLGQKLLEERPEFAEAWNFGPEESSVLKVLEILELAKKQWPDIDYEFESNDNQPHEANYLSLNIDKSKSKLGWHPVWDNFEAVEKTINWYKNYYINGVINTENDVFEYIKKYLNSTDGFL